jgi:UDP-3-O-[3-hydroxymyristoyl] N-acetylglucosamine deacetylase/3-hydroxyacyl-[acyl-carrier-protein] dehydratase
MASQQHTIKRAVSLAGLALHTGQQCKMTWKPAPPNHGIKFVRTDLDGYPVVEPLVTNVEDVTRWTTIASNHVKIHTVEHVLSTLAAFGVDNLIIELDASEPPVGDGSARPYVGMLKEAGLQPQDASREVYVPQAAVEVRVRDSFMALVPTPASDGLQVSCTIAFGKPGLDCQFFHVAVDGETFEEQIAPARTFAFYEDIEPLMDKGLIKGGSLENAVIIRGTSILSKEPLRFKDEFVRHKILDIIGDVRLLGRPVAGHIFAVRPSHAANHEFTRALAKQYEKDKGRPVTAPAPATSLAPGELALEAKRIMNIIPHRYPFMMVDRILKIEEARVVGVKNVTINEPFFQGHFPGHPVMPGVLQVEAIAQVAGVLMLRRTGNEGKVAYFMSADKVKFRRPVIPGDQLVIEAEMIKARSNIGKAFGQIKVNGEIVSEAEVTFTIVDKG